MDLILQEFFSHYENFVENGFELINNSYNLRCEFLGKQIKVSSLDKNKLYTAKRIKDDGSLLVSDENNKEINILTGDLTC